MQMRSAVSKPKSMYLDNVAWMYVGNIAKSNYHKMCTQTLFFIFVSQKPPRLIQPLVLSLANVGEKHLDLRYMTIFNDEHDYMLPTN